MIKKFNDGIAFSFWHHFGRPHGTAIRYGLCRTRLIGIRVTFMDVEHENSVQIGLWWAIGFSLHAVPQKLFSK